jgi:RHS repeat-associated protein
LYQGGRFDAPTGLYSSLGRDYSPTLGRWMQEDLFGAWVADGVGIDPQSPAENARLFAMASVAMTDAAIAAWDVKYEVDYWRPITAITEGNSYEYSAGQPTAMDFSPGAVTFHGQPVDFEGTETSFLGPVYDPIMVWPPVPWPPPPAQGGIFDATLPVQAQFIFVNKAHIEAWPIDIDPPVIILDSFDPPWIHLIQALPVPECTTNFIPGVAEW